MLRVQLVPEQLRFRVALPLRAQVPAGRKFTLAAAEALTEESKPPAEEHREARVSVRLAETLKLLAAEAEVARATERVLMLAAPVAEEKLIWKV